MTEFIQSIEVWLQANLGLGQGRAGDILPAFAAEDGVDFAYPTTRFYANPTEGKPAAGGPPRA